VLQCYFKKKKQLVTTCYEKGQNLKWSSWCATYMRYKDGIIEVYPGNQKLYHTSSLE